MTYKSGENEESLWSEQDGMYYDAIQFGPGNSMQLPVRSLVGLIPLYATLVLEPAVINRLPGFKKRMEWFIENRPEMSERNMANMSGEYPAMHHSICREASLTIIVQSRVVESEDYWPWLVKRDSNAFWRRCWMKMSSSANTASDRTFCPSARARYLCLT